MIRSLVFFILLLILYYAVRTVIRSALSAYQADDQPRQRSSRELPGEEMVQDPNCRTYVVKGRAVSRRIDGETAYFCSSTCADEYVRGRRS
jgi:uncharacterized protein